jgi:hypothetical protein
MAALSIYDLRTVAAGSFLAVDLVDILHLCDSQVQASNWHVSDVECIGEGADELRAISDSGRPLGGEELLRLAGSVSQVIDGDFQGFLNAAPRPWLIVRAVDSTFYVVITNDAVVLSKIRTRFKDVRESSVEEVDFA